MTPGRHSESWGGIRDRYKVRWTQITGGDPQTTTDGIKYVRWAIECKVPILPLAATGVDHSYFPLFDSFRLWSHIRPVLAARFPGYVDLLDAPRQLTLPPIPWIGLGPLGPWPYSPPMPVRITHYVCSPIRIAEMRRLAGVKPGDPFETDAQYARILRVIEKRIQRKLNKVTNPPPLLP